MGIDDSRFRDSGTKRMRLAVVASLSRETEAYTQAAMHEIALWLHANLESIAGPISIILGRLRCLSAAMTSG